jgi:hypothetical protein
MSILVSGWTIRRIESGLVQVKGSYRYIYGNSMLIYLYVCLYVFLYISTQLDTLVKKRNQQTFECKLVSKKKATERARSLQFKAGRIVLERKMPNSATWGRNLNFMADPCCVVYLDGIRNCYFGKLCGWERTAWKPPFLGWESN